MLVNVETNDCAYFLVIKSIYENRYLAKNNSVISNTRYWPDETAEGA